MLRALSSPGLRLTAVVTVALLAGSSVHAQDHPSTPHRHPAAQDLVNPVPNTPEAVAAGGQIYDRYCAPCHGTTGLGDGRVAAGAAAYGPPPSDLTDTVWQHGSSDGEIFTVIKDGIGPDFFMDAFAGLSDEQIWQVVHYLRTLQP